MDRAVHSRAATPTAGAAALPRCGFINVEPGNQRPLGGLLTLCTAGADAGGVSGQCSGMSTDVSTTLPQQQDCQRKCC